MNYICLNKQVIIIYFCLLNIFIFGQNDALNVRKYWYYKSRLNNDFIKIGTNEGESLPFMQRGVNSSSFSSGVSEMYIGDGTSILGYYIAQLALEYYLLSKNNQNTDSTLYELSCALYAINRLDIKAEQALGYGGNLLNGFFIRDDVPCDFVKNNYDHFNYFSKGIHNNNLSRGFMSKFDLGMKSSTSDGCNVSYPGSFISQDQVYNLLYGLAFVRKFIPNNVKAIDKNGSPMWFQDGQTYISEETKAIAKRIIDNIRDPKKYDGSSCEGNTGTGWHIKNPLNCNQLSSGFGGHDLTPFSYPLAESECMLDQVLISGDETALTFYNAPSYCSGFFDFPGQYHNVFSRTGGYTLWRTTPLGTNLSMDIKVFVGNLASICNCYYTLPTILGYYENNTPGMLSSFVNKPVNLVKPAPLNHPPISWYVLHYGANRDIPYVTGSTGSFSLLQYQINHIKNLVDQGPCDDIYYLPNENPKYASYEWSSDNRCDHPNRLGGNEQDFEGEYNGIDFMLFSNLWYTYRNAINPNSFYFSNLSHIFIDKNNKWYFGDIVSYPVQTINLSKHTPINLDAFETVIIQKTEIPVFKDSYIRAGKFIHLKPDTWLRPATSLDTCIECTATENPSTYKATMRLYVKSYSSACEYGNVCEGCRFTNNNEDTLSPEITHPHFFHYVEYPATNEISNHNLNNNIISDNSAEEINQIIDGQNITIYPNPASEYIVIKTSLPSDELTITLYNVLGEVVKTTTIKEYLNEYLLSLLDVTAGIYYLKITLPSGEYTTYKINVIK